MTTTRSSGDIAMDLTEICTHRTSKLSSIESKDKLIMASNGSLISAGKESSSSLSEFMVSVNKDRTWYDFCFCVLIPGSADSEVSEEQKKEKIAELKKKEKDIQDKLAQKLEELKKICMREAVSVSLFPLWGAKHQESQLTASCVISRILQADCRKSIPWQRVRSLPKCDAVLGQPSSWMTSHSTMRLVVSVV